jgi:serine O-acetyltransferase
MNVIYFFFFDASYRLKLNYLIGRHLIYKRNFFSKLIVAYLRNKQITKRNCHISYNANIDMTIKFPHPIGIVIGDDVVIGKNVKIWQQVTLGSHGKKTQNFDYPIIEEDVKIFAGAKIIGGVTIGKGAIIGANAVVFINVPAGKTAVGIPAKIK